MGQVPAGAILLVENTEAAEKVAVEAPDSLAYITQTTLSVADPTEIIAVLMLRFPKIPGPTKDNNCTATTNHHEETKEIALRRNTSQAGRAPNHSPPTQM